MKGIKIAERLYFVASLLAFGGLALSASVILLAAGIWLLLVAGVVFASGLVVHLSSTMSKRIASPVKRTLAEGGAPKDGVAASWEAERLKKEMELGMLLRRREAETSAW